MATRVVIEVEEGGLQVTIASVAKDAITVASCVRLPLAELSGAAFKAALWPICQQQTESVQQVHLLIGDRRVQHFLARVPRLDGPELQAFVVREALRHGSLQAGTEMCAHARVFGRLSGGLRYVAVSAAPTIVLQPFVKACAELGITVASACSIETGLAAALPVDTPAQTAVVEMFAGKARFVACEQGVPRQVRRFVVHGKHGELGDAGMIAAQLAIEVPRTIDFLREQGMAPPQALVFGQRLGIGADDLEPFRTEVPDVRLHAAAVGSEEGRALPGLATWGLLGLLQREQPVPSLLGGVNLQVPPQRTVQAARVGAAALVLTAGWLGVHQQVQLADVLTVHTTVQMQQEAARLQLTQLGAAPAMETRDPDDARQSDVLAARRPVSRALAAICNAVPDGVELHELLFVDAARLQVRGSVLGVDRMQAFERLELFAAQLRELPYLVRQGAEDVQADAVSGRVDFKFELGWRKP